MIDFTIELQTPTTFRDLPVGKFFRSDNSCLLYKDSNYSYVSELDTNIRMGIINQDMPVWQTEQVDV